MKNKRNNSAAKWLIGCALVVAGSSAMADWSFGTGSTIATSGSGLNAITATATGLSTTGAGSTFVAATSITSYSGLGLGVLAAGETNTSPQHSTDNSGSTDAILLSFNSSVVLTGLTIGWNWTGTAATTAGADTDVSLLRYTGPVTSTTTAATVSASTIGKTVAQLTDVGGGWTLVSQLADLVVGTNKSTGDTTLGSSWWLVSAYNSLYGTSSTSSSTGLSNGNDYFKLLTVAGNATPTTTSRVPEPASLALVGVGLLGLMGSVRRRKAAKGCGLTA